MEVVADTTDDYIDADGIYYVEKAESHVDGMLSSSLAQSWIKFGEVPHNKIATGLNGLYIPKIQTRVSKYVSCFAIDFGHSGNNYSATVCPLRVREVRICEHGYR